MGRKDKVVDSPLRRARQAEQLSLADLAARTHYGKNYLSAMETGRTPVTREAVRAYEEALRLAPGILADQVWRQPEAASRDPGAGGEATAGGEGPEPAAAVEPSDPTGVPAPTGSGAPRPVLGGVPALLIVALVLLAVFVAARQPAADPPAREPPRSVRPGGLWISPEEGQVVTGPIAFAARAYATRPGDPGVARVQFTVAWPGRYGPWVVACRLDQPVTDDVYTCRWDPIQVGAPAGPLRVSFDVFDNATPPNVNEAPHGVRTLTYDPPADKPPAPDPVADRATDAGAGPEPR